MKSILPIASHDLATKVKELGFREPVFAKYRNGVLCDEGISTFEDYNGMNDTDLISFFGEVGNYYAVVIRRKDGLTRESKRVVSSNLALEAGIKTAVSLLCKKRKHK